MRIAFVSQQDPDRTDVWSGTPHAMLQCLRRRGHEVVKIAPIAPPFYLLLLVARKIHSLLGGKFYPIERNPLVAAALSRQVARRLHGQHFDLILSPSSIPCAHLEADCPIVFWADATFSSLVNYHPGDFSNLSHRALEHGHALERRAIANASLCLYASDWAARSALDDYGADPAKVKVIRFGANLTNPPARATVEAAIARRSTDCCNLLFIGVNWLPKGGDVLLATAQELVGRGLRVRVHVVGCEPEGRMPDFVERYGFVSKSDTAGMRLFDELMRTAHYLVVPTRAECFGIVFAEAAAYGVPSLAYATGGVPSAIGEGINGHTFPSDADHHAFADHIFREFNDPDAYCAAALNARRQFEHCLNWDAAMAGFEAAAQPLIAAASNPLHPGSPARP